MNEQFAQVNGIELCYETFGDPTDPPVLLIMGLGTQMVAWQDDFCEQLAGRGYFVTRYDNRDVGRSTRFDPVPPPGPAELLTRRPRQLAYTLADMADDAAGLIEHLGHESAHVVGVSMGGMIGQTLAINRPERVRSFVSIMSTTGSRFVGQPAAAVYPFFMKAMPTTKEGYLDRGMKLWSVIGSPGFKTHKEDVHRMLSTAYDRGLSPAGTMRQLAAIVASGNRTKDLARIKAPTLVIHGTNDKMISVSGGKATARAIPGARLDLVEGMGHDMPRGVWDRLIEGIEQTVARAEPAAEAEAEQAAA
jgi:pimeloyl-ACP methyl ester carboxylesterase